MPPPGGTVSRAGIRILRPAALGIMAGTHAALPRGAFCPRPRAIRLTIGTPRVYAHLPPTKEAATQICHELREAVIRLGQAKLEG